MEDLQEAYLAVYEANKADEFVTSSMFTNDKHIKDAKKRRRQLRDFKGVLNPADFDSQGEPVRQKAHRDRRGVRKEEIDSYDVVLDYLLDEGYADSEDNAITIMANMSEEWIDTILDEAAKDQSNKQIEKGVKTTYKAGNVLDNLHQGRSRGINKLDPRERDAKVERMRKRLKNRRDDLFGERNRREDEKISAIKKLLGM